MVVRIGDPLTGVTGGTVRLAIGLGIALRVVDCDLRHALGRCRRVGLTVGFGFAVGFGRLGVVDELGLGRICFALRLRIELAVRLHVSRVDVGLELDLAILGVGLGVGL